MSRLYSPSPSVRSSRTPHYLRGVGLGDDLLAPDLGPAPGSTMPDSPGFFAPVNYDLQPFIDRGFNADTADLIATASASGTISSGQFDQIMSGHLSASDIENLILDSGNFAHAAINPNRPSSTSAAGQLIKAGTAAVQAAHPTANLPPGAAPRVATPPPASATPWNIDIVHGQTFGIPNWLVLAGIGIGLFAFSRGGR